MSSTELGAIQDTFDEYLSKKHLLSSTDVAALYVSPREFIRQRNQQNVDKKHLRLGSAVHCMLTEPFNFEELFPVIDISERPEKEKTMTSKLNKAWRFNFDREAKAAGKTVLTAKQKAEVLERKKSIETNDTACRLLNDCTDFETSYYALISFGDKQYYCRVRPDAVAPDYYVSIKTTKRPRPEDFPRECVTYNYQIKEAFYWMVLNAVRRATGKPELKNGYIIAIGETETFVYELNPEQGRVNNGVSSYIADGLHLVEISLSRFDKIQQGRIESAAVNYGGQEIFTLHNPTYNQTRIEQLIEQHNEQPTDND